MTAVKKEAEEELQNKLRIKTQVGNFNELMRQRTKNLLEISVSTSNDEGSAASVSPRLPFNFDEAAKTRMIIDNQHGNKIAIREDDDIQYIDNSDEQSIGYNDNCLMTQTRGSGSDIAPRENSNSPLTLHKNRLGADKFMPISPNARN